MQLGTSELIILAIVIAIVFSASRMTALGNALGKFVYSFKKASGGNGFVDGKVEKRLTREGKIEDAEVVEDPNRKA
jgi:sec-independent protein translocase protein TatA